MPGTLPARPSSGKSARLLVCARISNANDFARSGLSCSMYSTIATRLASAVLVHLTAVFRKEGMDFSLAGEFASIGLCHTLLDIADLQRFGV